jgi:hypothetical protein
VASVYTNCETALDGGHDTNHLRQLEAIAAQSQGL